MPFRESHLGFWFLQVLQALIHQVLQQDWCQVAADSRLKQEVVQQMHQSWLLQHGIEEKRHPASEDLYQVLGVLLHKQEANILKQDAPRLAPLSWLRGETISCWWRSLPGLGGLAAQASSRAFDT